MMATLYNVGLPTINEHIKKIYADSELEESTTIRNFRIVQTFSLQKLVSAAVFVHQSAHIPLCLWGQSYYSTNSEVYPYLHLYNKGKKERGKYGY